MCCKGVTKASKAVSCDGCGQWTHVRCTPLISLDFYQTCVTNGGEIPFSCDICDWASLPFNDADIDDGLGISTGVTTAPVSSSSLPIPPLPKVLLQKGLHFLHANTRSLLPKISEICLLLSRTKASVFAVSETWIDSSIGDGEIALPGFNVVRQDRDRTGGGVALYIRDSISFNPRPDLAVNGMEVIWVELLLPRTKGILACACYRPPSDGDFLSKLEQSLSKVEPGKELLILGDLNINVGQSSPLVSKYIDILNVYNCSQIISESTRVTPSCSSVLDHIIVNSMDKIKESGVIDYGFSDHLVTFCS